MGRKGGPRPGPFLLLCTLAGFLLRAWALGAKDLRGDEGFAAVFASQSLGGIWAALGTSEPHPPLYYGLLHLFIGAGGPSTFTLRYLSVLLGTLAIPALGVAAWQALGGRAGVVAAVLTTVNPLLVWQAQDARMYAPLVGWSALALAGAAGMARDGRATRARWLALLVGVGGALLTHYYAVFLAIGLTLGLLGAVRLQGGKAKRGARLFALAPVLAVLCLALPLAWHGRAALAGHPPFAPLGVADLLHSLGLTIAGGFTTDLRVRNTVGWGAVALPLVGLAAAWLRRRAVAALLTAAVGVPTLGFLALEALHPAYQPQYAAVLAPAWLLAVAALAAVPLPLGWLSSSAATVLAGGAAVAALTIYAHIGKGQTWRAAAALLEQQGQPGDVVVLNYPDPTLRWVYSRQDGGALPILLEPASGPAAPPELGHTLATLGDRYDRVWFWTLRTAAWDPRHATELWLDRHALPLRTVAAGDVTFRLFETPAGFLRGTRPLPDQTFAGQIRLRGAAWAGASVAAGATLDVELCWQAVAAPSGDYTAFVHLERAGTLGGQDDHPPLHGLDPMHTWQPGESFLDAYHVVVPPGTPPGVYAVRVGLYTPSTLRRLPVQNADGSPAGDSVTVGEITVR